MVAYLRIKISAGTGGGARDGAIAWTSVDWCAVERGRDVRRHRVDAASVDAGPVGVARWRIGGDKALHRLLLDQQLLGRRGRGHRGGFGSWRAGAHVTAPGAMARHLAWNWHRHSCQQPAVRRLDLLHPRGVSAGAVDPWKNKIWPVLAAAGDARAVSRFPDPAGDDSLHGLLQLARDGQPIFATDCRG